MPICSNIGYTTNLSCIIVQALHSFVLTINRIPGYTLVSRNWYFEFCKEEWRQLICYVWWRASIFNALPHHDNAMTFFVGTILWARIRQLKWQIYLSTGFLEHSHYSLFIVTSNWCYIYVHLYFSIILMSADAVKPLESGSLNDIRQAITQSGKRDICHQPPLRSPRTYRFEWTGILWVATCRKIILDVTCVVTWLHPHIMRAS